MTSLKDCTNELYKYAAFLKEAKRGDFLRAYVKRKGDARITNIVNKSEAMPDASTGLQALDKAFKPIYLREAGRGHQHAAEMLDSMIDNRGTGTKKNIGKYLAQEEASMGSLLKGLKKTYRKANLTKEQRNYVDKNVAPLFDRMNFKPNTYSDYVNPGISGLHLI